jgi:isocitrate lyase
MLQQEEIQRLEATWRSDERWNGIERTYSAEDVVRLRGSVVEEHTLARIGAERLWQLIQADRPVRALGALTGGQAVQMVRAGLEAIYLSGWQVAADANLAGATYPDQSLYPANSAPPSSVASTTPSSALTRSTGPRAETGRTGSRRSSPTPRPASGARSTRTS